MEQQDNLFNTFDKTLYRQGAPLYKGDGNPITDISNIEPSNVGDGYPTGNTEMVKGAFQSGNFLTGVRGWQLTPDSAEFQTAIFNIGGTVITIDNTQDIQTNLDLISTSGGGTLFLQPGTYTLTSDISIPEGVTLQGVSRDGVIIDCNGSYKVQIIGTNAYTAGTISINDGQDEVVGAGTTFTPAMVGQYIYLNGLWYEITAFTDTTHIDIAIPYAGTNLSGYAYAIATVNFNSVIRKLTISGATGAGFKINYANEPWIDDLIITGNGTGMDLDYVVFPKMFVLCDTNGVNLDMNYVSGFKVDYCSFSFSTIGAGVVMSNIISATFFDSAVDENTGDGMNMTNCQGVAIISNSFSDNGGQGIEMVSGCNDCQMIALVVDGNTSDGIKLTATDDRNTVVASSIVNNGGYGINIAAATCDNNQIIAPAFSGNSSGTINDLGTNTFVSPQDVFTPEYKNGTSTYDTATATGTKNIAHGMGATPSFVKLTFLSQGQFGSGTLNNVFTIYNGTTTSTIGFCYANGALRDCTGTSILLYGPTGGSNTEFVTGVVTLDATNISIAFTKTNSPTGTYSILWEAYK